MVMTKGQWTTKKKAAKPGLGVSLGRFRERQTIELGFEVWVGGSQVKKAKFTEIQLFISIAA